jgi:hypothetical protein
MDNLPLAMSNACEVDISLGLTVTHVFGPPQLTWQIAGLEKMLWSEIFFFFRHALECMCFGSIVTAVICTYIPTQRPRSR